MDHQVSQIIRRQRRYCLASGSTMFSTRPWLRNARRWNVSCCALPLGYGQQSLVNRNWRHCVLTDSITPFSMSSLSAPISRSAGPSSVGSHTVYSANSTRQQIRNAGRQSLKSKSCIIWHSLDAMGASSFQNIWFLTTRRHSRREFAVSALRPAESQVVIGTESNDCSEVKSLIV